MQLNLKNESTVLVRIGDDTEAAFEKICRDNPKLRVEQTEKGEILVMAPTGSESSYRENQIAIQLGAWAMQERRGKTFNSNTVFRLSDGSKLGPDAAWISQEKLGSFSTAQRKGFLPVAPEFIIELRSETDRINDLHKKMEAWIRNGVELAWLIDAEKRRVWIYKPGVEAMEQVEPAFLIGEGPVVGFKLAMEEIYRGLSF